MDIQLTAYIVGLLSSVVTEIFKYFPVLAKNQITKVMTSVVVMVVGTLFSIGFNAAAWDWEVFGQVVIWSFVNYKMIVQPMAKTAGLVTQ